MLQPVLDLVPLDDLLADLRVNVADEHETTADTLDRVLHAIATRRAAILADALLPDARPGQIGHTRAMAASLPALARQQLCVDCGETYSVMVDVRCPYCGSAEAEPDPGAAALRRHGGWPIGQVLDLKP